MRVWLAILRERHPGVSWVAAEREPHAAIATEPALVATDLSARHLTADASR